MDFLSIVLISIGLAMDAFAVSIANGIQQRPLSKSFLAKNTILFGLFQGLLFFIGFIICFLFADNVPSIKDFISEFDHWLALVLLSVLGLKMIAEDLKSRKTDEEEICCRVSQSISLGKLVVLSIAVSIDAFVTGIVFVSHTNIVILSTAIIILGSLIFSGFGVWLGATVGKKIKIRPNIIGGLILIAIGVKIFVEHTCE